MGSRCSKNKAKAPKRRDMNELTEKENFEGDKNEETPQAIDIDIPEDPIENEYDEPVEDDNLDLDINDNKSFDRNLDDLDKSNSDIYSESHKYENDSDKLETGSQITLSTDATGIVQQITKLTEPAHEESIYNTYKSTTPCDMDKMDETAKIFSRRCGCDLGDRHDENACKICRKIDLSDTPLLA
ncbi:hypothetical protein YYC_01543 [Plasmodium yoelii 17X]|uniref:Glideosome-associated protein 45 n=3 Tax=Plasmodium yoelii TaxID=5861 RepID=A0AAE9WVK2_PLAYO|nr:glideosome-associated protein 45, putative [Plasmodium yoelii]ETB61705.1 hypothetical protein YYC_01543 [Plasmodium yoelii 17X]WBY60997.1 glideosome-associated protein 45 [Plasmodium yoelii yoelii]CDU20746.1 glideosome-associated protein 45, putative [Plasmodium yoelii]VTZ81709.1 glideosome-associated protein 45, putative [Plasmodium yoelii]|eukprot:XP_731454.2 glideosome-associated protein 45, putative [Plasmodium yoelii]